MSSSKWLLSSCAGLLLSATSSVFALSLTVNTPTDLPDASPGDGQCLTSVGSCSLRAAVMEANAWGADPVDTITLPAGNYRLTRVGVEEEALFGDLDITAAVVITGAGAASTTIDGNDSDRIFDIYSAGNLTLDAVTLRRGALFDTTWDGNGNISGPTSVQDSIHGGAIRVQGRLLVRNSVLTDNGAQGDGGAIHAMFGNVTIENSTIDANRGRGFGSGIFIQDGELRIVDSVISNNTAPGFPATIVGGGLAIFGAKVQIEGTTFSGNEAFRDGGAIYYALGDVNIVNSTFSNNYAKRFGGAIYVSGGSNSGAGFNWFQSIRLSNVTIAYNRASAVSNDQFITHPAGGGIFLNNLGTITMNNTLLSDNYGDDCYVGSGGALISQGTNLDSDGSCALSGVGDISGVGSASLLPLADNGGPTPTHALAADSPALNKGNDLLCGVNGSVDQRGYVRPASGCDIGAFELEGDSGIAPPPPPPDEPAGNLPPVALDMLIALEGGGSYTGVLNAVDPNGDVLEFEIVDQVGFHNPSGFGMAFLIAGDGEPASFIYRADIENPVDSDMFTYRACDPWGRCSNTAQVRVLIDQTQGAANLPSLEVASTTVGNVDGVTVLSQASLAAVTGGIDYTYPVGGLVLSVTDVPVDGAGAGQATVTLQFPPSAEIRADAVVRKLDLFSEWRTLSSTQPVDPLTGDPIVATWAEIDAVNRTITLHLVDNDGVFDRNPVTGVIDDPVALALPVNPVVEVAPVDGGSSSGGEDSGSSANSGGGAGWWLVLLSGLWLGRRLYR